MKLSAFTRSIFVAFAWLALGLTAARAQATLPRAQVAVAYGYTVVTSPAAPSGTVYSATGLPTGLSINASTGVIGGTPIAPGTATGSVSLTSGGVTNSFTYTLVVDPAAGTPAITSAATLAGTVGTPIAAYTVTASNTPSSFNVGALPPGLSFASPTISGTPTVAGTFTVALSANNGVGTGAAITLTVTISPAGSTPAITSLLAASAPLNAAFTYTITASNTPVSFSAAPLPAGLTLNTTTGVISGTPTVGGVYSVSLSATNNNGTGAASILVLTLGSVPVISSVASAAGNALVPFSFNVTATNTPTSFNLSGLPPGLSANTTTGFISGTPTAGGTFSVTLSANNTVGTGPSSTLNITIGAAPGSGGGGGGGGGGGVILPVAPIITAQPVAVTITSGESATFTVFAAGTGTLTYQWRKDGAAISGATNSSFSIIIPQASDIGTYDVVVTNSVGSTTSAAVTLTLAGLLTPPLITTQPVALTVATGATATFTVVASGNPAPSYQWRKGGTAIAGATGATLSLANVSAADAATYAVVVTNSQGTVTSAGAALTVTPLVGPAITTQPAARTGTIGGSVTFSVAATGSGLTYQWQRNGVAIPGATSAALTLNNVQGSDSGTYTVIVTNAAGSVTSAGATLTVPASRLANVSVRSGAGAGDRSLIVGFVVGGAGPKQMLLRGVGPGLTQFGVPGALADPQLRLFNAAGVQTDFNDDWGGGAALSGAFTATGAFTLSPTSKDAALLLPLAVGSYTTQVTASVGSGVALLEGYDADATPAAARLINLSARTQVGVDDNILVVGFVITGTGPKNILIRGVGPGLTQFGLGGVLVDPQLRLFNSAGTEINTNDDWAGTAALSAAFTATGAFGLPAASKDAALLVTLQPGAYTAQLSGANRTTGVALVEVYEAP